MSDLGNVVSESTAAVDGAGLSAKHAALLSAAERVGNTGSWQWNSPAGDFLCSDGFCLLHGVKPGALNGSLEDLMRGVHGDDAPKLEAEFQAIQADGLLRAVEYRVVRPGGETRFLRAQVALNIGSNGGDTSLIGAVSDVTEARTDSQSEANELLRGIINNAASIIYVKDLDGRYLLVNSLFETLFNVEGDAVIGKTDYDLFPKEHADQYRANDLKALESSRPVSAEETVPLSDGLHHYASVKFPLRRSDDALFAVGGISTDITERKKADEERWQLEEQIRHVQKLESLGVLAGGIAHDFNNLLTGILGNADLALMDMSPASPARSYLKNIAASSRRAADLTKQMLAYSGKGKFVTKNISLNEIIEEMVHFLDVSVSKNVVKKFELSKLIPEIQADVTQINQVIMNLVINASEAIGEKSGVILIKTGAMQCRADYLKEIWGIDELSEGLYVYLEVTDTGSGMTKETREKLFDPFFTTKFTGRGLGMAAVQGIVRGHGGAINVYSEIDKGTTFKLLFPAVEAAPMEDFVDAAVADPRPMTGTVLLVDDDETVRGVGRLMLKKLGFTVVVASDGVEALEIYRKRGDEFALVVLDLTMPHMGGEDCMRELRRLDKDVAVIMTSGYNEQDVTQRFVGKGLSGFIAKPPELENMRKVITEALTKLEK